MSEFADQKIVKLSDRDHVLKRPAIYIGAVDETEYEGYFYDSTENKIVFKKVKYSPAFLKIINEIIDNSTDEAKRTNFKFANDIKITVGNTIIKVEDNGRGIPVTKVEGYDEYQPELAFCHAKAGSNFNDDDERVTAGMNGVGSFATNCFSKSFIASTSDGKNRLTLTCKDNLSSRSIDIQKCTDRGTKVIFEPDFQRFKIDNNISNIYRDLIKNRLINLSLSYPKINFTFNNEKIEGVTFENVVKMFGENYEILSEKSKRYSIAILNNEYDDFKFYSSANGLLLANGGTHIDYVASKIVDGLKEKIAKKYPNIKYGDIKNKLRLVCVLNDFKNMKFDSQTKERLTNSAAEIKEYFGEIDFDSLVEKIYKNEEITDPIVETYRIKEEFKKRKELKAMNKGDSVKRVINEKYLAPIERKKYLVLAEGDSASGGLSPVLGRKEFGYFALKGKPLNTLEVKFDKILKNEEIENIVSILNLDLSDDKSAKMDFENVLIAADADCDGFHIIALSLTLFYKFCPELIKQGKIKFLKTPIILAYKGSEIYKMFFDLEEYEEFNKTNTVKNLKFQYFKGLGTWKKEILQGIIKKHGVENFIYTFDYTEESEKCIQSWFGKGNSDVRKMMIKNSRCNIGAA